MNRLSLALAALAGSASAFPSINPDAMHEFESRQSAPDPTTNFNAKEQLVSNTGTHAFIAPSGSDQRGPCPGLNAAANHVSLRNLGRASSRPALRLLRRR